MTSEQYQEKFRVANGFVLLIPSFCRDLVLAVPPLYPTHPILEVHFILAPWLLVETNTSFI